MVGWVRNRWKWLERRGPPSGSPEKKRFVKRTRSLSHPIRANLGQPPSAADDRETRYSTISPIV